MEFNERLIRVRLDTCLNDSDNYARTAGEFTGCVLKSAWQGNAIELFKYKPLIDYEGCDSIIESIRCQEEAVEVSEPQNVFRRIANSQFTKVSCGNAQFFVGRGKIIQKGWGPLFMVTFTYNKEVHTIVCKNIYVPTFVFYSFDEESMWTYLKECVLPTFYACQFQRTNVIIGNCPNIIYKTNELKDDIFNINDRLIKKVPKYAGEIARNVLFSNSSY